MHGLVAVPELVLEGRLRGGLLGDGELQRSEFLLELGSGRFLEFLAWRHS